MISIKEYDIAYPQNEGLDMQIQCIIIKVAYVIQLYSTTVSLYFLKYVNKNLNDKIYVKLVYHDILLSIKKKTLFTFNCWQSIYFIKNKTNRAYTWNSDKIILLCVVGLTNMKLNLITLKVCCWRIYSGSEGGVLWSIGINGRWIEDWTKECV